MKNFLISFVLFLSLVGCAQKSLVQSNSATILIKTPAMKFYDKGFISKYSDHTQVQIYSAGQTVLDMKIYEDRVCESTFKCLDLKSFNKSYLHSSYDENFIKELFEREEKEVVFRDRVNRVLIKIIKE